MFNIARAMAALDGVEQACSMHRGECVCRYPSFSTRVWARSCVVPCCAVTLVERGLALCMRSQELLCRSLTFVAGGVAAVSLRVVIAMASLPPFPSSAAAPNARARR